MKNIYLIFIFLLSFMHGYTNDHRIMFMGDSITEAWLTEDPEFFDGKPYMNRGISGQTTKEMLDRFQKDMIDSKPSVVVILAGTNDIAENGGPITLEEIHKNIMEMTKLAQTNQIRVVLCSVLPAYDYPWRTGLKPAEKIVRLNEMIRNHARQNGFTYCDYYSSLVDERKGLKSSYSEDGVHPNISGYKVMEPIVERAIEEALKQ